MRAANPGADKPLRPPGRFQFRRKTKTISRRVAMTQRRMSKTIHRTSEVVFPCILVPLRLSERLRIWRGYSSSSARRAFPRFVQRRLFQLPPGSAWRVFQIRCRKSLFCKRIGHTGRSGLDCSNSSRLFQRGVSHTLLESFSRLEVLTEVTQRLTSENRPRSQTIRIFGPPSGAVGLAENIAFAVRWVD